MLEYTEDHTLKSIGSDEARSGVTGHGVRYVLAAGLGLAILCFLTIPLFV
jgi:hypothetical protein